LNRQRRLRNNRPIESVLRTERADRQGSLWIKTIPGKGWFTYFRIYGPEQAAFDGSWKPGDFELMA